MGMWSWFTGGSENVGKVIDGVKSGIDYAVYTDQEKVEANQKVLDWTLKYMECTNPQNIARRLIALVVVAMWALLVLIAVAAHGLGQLEFSQFVFKTLSENVNDPFSIIIGFYFLAHVIRNSAWGGKK